MSRQDSSNRQRILNFPVHPEYTFENFILSTGSDFAFTTARQFSTPGTAPSQSLFIAGAAGLGKTHLLMAAGNLASETQSALYIHCDDFLATVAGGEKSNEAALAPLETVDLLLMDDMDRIAGHTEAQEKLYLVFNTRREHDKRIVFAGRTAPNRLPDTESYLRSRFQWGVTAELGPIDDATTGQLVKKLGQDMNLEVPDKITHYLLTRLPRDFSSIKNAVSRINTESLARRQKVTLPLVKAALGLQDS
ncbi:MULTISPECIES: DnaA/Hda family protein [unclassified Nitrospina]|uniref:DnaA/Hda family protein n=1 Tax=unclassified Nitrospina TaxID=2638683 RepID=UPI003F9EB0E4